MISRFVACAFAAALAAGCQFDVPAGEPLGAFELHWTLILGDRVGGCDEAGAAAVDVRYEARSEPAAFRDTFPCRLGAAEADLLPLADYEVSARLLDAEGQVLQRAAPMEVSLAAEVVMVLPMVTFQLEPERLGASGISRGLGPRSRPAQAP